MVGHLWGGGAGVHEGARGDIFGPRNEGTIFRSGCVCVEKGNRALGTLVICMLYSLHAI